MKEYPPFIWATTACTHGGVFIGLIESCGQIMWIYIRVVGRNLYVLGYSHPEKWLDWDADRAALLLPGPEHTVIWPYLGLAIVAVIAAWKIFAVYLFLVRAANQQAWTWFSAYLAGVFRKELDEDLKPWISELIEELQPRFSEQNRTPSETNNQDDEGENDLK